MYKLNKNLFFRIQKMQNQNNKIFLKDKRILFIQKEKMYIILLRLIYLIFTKKFF